MRSRASTSRCRKAPCSVCSGPTAPARRPPCASSPRCSRPPAGALRSTASTSFATPRSSGSASASPARARRSTRTSPGSRTSRWSGGSTTCRRPRPVAAAGEVLERFGLSDAAGRPAKTYSGGMRRRLDLAASLVGRPDILFLDEPTTGLDPRSRIDVWDFVRELQDEGTTLLLTTQYLDEADQLADRIAVIDVGTVIAEGTSDELKARIGGEVLELHVEDRTKLKNVADVLMGIGSGAPTIDEEAGVVRIPVGQNGFDALRDSVRRLDETKTWVADIALHRPTLDDVFLSLTGRVAEDGAGVDDARPLPAEVEAAGRRRRTHEHRGADDRPTGAVRHVGARCPRDHRWAAGRPAQPRDPHARAHGVHLRAGAAGDVRAAVPVHLREPVPVPARGARLRAVPDAGHLRAERDLRRHHDRDRARRGPEDAASSTGSARCRWHGRPCWRGAPRPTSRRTWCSCCSSS